MKRRNTIQKELILETVQKLHRHVTAEEVCEAVRAEHPTIGKGTVYRNLGILAEEGKIRRVEIPDGADCYDFQLSKHYHVRCVKCGAVFDVDLKKSDDMTGRIRDTHGIQILDYDILFKGICPNCQQGKEEHNG